MLATVGAPLLAEYDAPREGICAAAVRAFAQGGWSAEVQCFATQLASAEAARLLSFVDARQPDEVKLTQPGAECLARPPFLMRDRPALSTSSTSETAGAPHRDS